MTDLSNATSDEVLDHLLETCLMCLSNAIQADKNHQRMGGKSNESLVDLYHRTNHLIYLYKKGICDKENLVKALELVKIQISKKVSK